MAWSCLLPNCCQKGLLVAAQYRVLAGASGYSISRIDIMFSAIASRTEEDLGMPSGGLPGAKFRRNGIAPERIMWRRPPQAQDV
jgi:hypothetical protein